MDFFGVVEAARTHVILFIVLTGAWVLAQKWLATFNFTRTVFFPMLRLFVVTAGTGLLSFPTLLFGDVNAVFNFVASIAVICVWAAAIFHVVLFVAPQIVPTLEHPLLIKHTAPILNAEWFVRIRKTCSEAYWQSFYQAHTQQEYAGGGGQQQEEQQSRASNADDDRMTYERALEIMELSDGATEQNIRDAFNRLMQRVHPDVGGSNFFAKQLNVARDVLLKRRRT